MPTSCLPLPPIHPGIIEYHLVPSGTTWYHGTLVLWYWYRAAALTPTYVTITESPYNKSMSGAVCYKVISYTTIKNTHITEKQL